MGCTGAKEEKPAKAGGGKKGGKKGKNKDQANGNIVVVDNRGAKIQETYDVDKKKIGEGSYGTVCVCVNKATKQKRAVKALSKTQMKNIEKFKEEIRIMTVMDHPNIIKLYETFEDKVKVYLVMELCTGGELFDRIIELGHFTEVQAAMVMQQMLRAVYYMHKNSFCHRDLKPENFLFATKEPIEKTHLKIIDFGLAFEFKKDVAMTTKAGTPFYVAPQVLEGKYDQAADLWSCGVIMYVLLCGYPPFWGDTDKEVLRKVSKGQFSFNPADWKNVSEDAKGLIRSLLKMSPKDRYTAEQALNDEWVRERAPRATNVPIGTGLVDNLKGFRSQNKLKKAALHVIASQMSDAQIKDLRETFIAMDENGDGLLTVKELEEGMHKAGMEEIPPELHEIIKDVDSNGSGTIDYTEFLAATLDRKNYIAEDVCWAAFRVFDKDGSGAISKEELTQVLSDGAVAAVAQKDIADLLNEVDQNGDGEIDFQEFMHMMRAVDGHGGLMAA
mmetsp:Transcript_27553/g.64214  ORF Transcript_27553/g.64214 Transcript_27553/m.64214 type:complete len:500 (+) Transcript_27553:23-1522(+)